MVPLTSNGSGREDLNLSDGTSSGSPSGPGVLIAICTRDRAHEANRCVRSIIDQMQQEDRILIVDNSGDGSFSLSERHPDTKRIDVVHEPVSGYSAARNRAIDEMGDEWAILYIDDDEIADPEWLASHRTYASMSPADVVFGPIVSTYPPGGDRRIAKGRLFDRPRFATGTQRRSGSSGNVLIKSSSLRRLAVRFDPKFNLTGGEDNDLFTRMYSLGARLEWNDGAVATEPVLDDRMCRAGARARFVRLGYARCRQLEETHGLVFLLARIVGHLILGVVNGAWDACRGEFTSNGIRRIWSASGGMRYLFDSRLRIRPARGGPQ